MTVNRNIFKTNALKSWANIMNESSQRRRSTRHAKRRELGQASGTPSPANSGDTKKVGDKLMIYTKKPVVLANGKTVRGHWVRASDPNGNYGGPYANMRNLLSNPKYKSDEANIEETMRRYKNSMRNPTRSRRSRSPPTRSRRSRSSSTRSRRG